MGLRTAVNAPAFDRVVALLAGLSLLCVFLLPSQSGASFATYLVALLVLGGGVRRWREFFEGRVLSLSLLALLLYFSSSVWWSQTSSVRGAWSIYSRCVLMLTFVIAVSTSMGRVPQTMRWLARSVALAAAIVGGVALVDLHLHPTWDGRLAGLGQLHNSVVAGFAFAAGLMFALSVLLERRPAWRATAVACVALIAAAVYASGSRAAYLSGALGAWTLVWARRGSATGSRLASPLTWAAGPLVCAGAVLIALMIHPGWTEILLPRGDSFRLEIWAAEWQRLMEHGLWFGLGVLVPDDVVLRGQVFVHPHSLYLASALQGGLIGLLLLLGVLLCAGFKLYRARQFEEAQLGLALLAAGMSAYLLDGWELIDKVSVSWLLLWVPVAVAIGVQRKMEDQREMSGLRSSGRVRDPIEAPR